MDMKELENLLKNTNWYDRYLEKQTIEWEKDFKMAYMPIFKNAYYTPTHIDLKPRKELIHGDFGKSKIPYIEINGSVIGNCLNNPKEIWKDNMTNIEFLKLVLKVDLKMEPMNYDYLIPILEELDIYGKSYC